MRTLPFCFVASFSLLTAFSALAQDKYVPTVAPKTYAPPVPAFELGVRLGYSAPIGSVYQGQKTADFFGQPMSIMLDMGTRINRYVYIGFLGEFAPGFGDNYFSGPGVSARSYKGSAGANVQAHILPNLWIDPWLGAGIGVAYGVLTAKEGSESAKVVAVGYEANVQTGVDFRINRRIALGPFISFAFGQYTHLAASGASLGVQGEIKDKAMHEWLTVGLRGSFDL